MKIFKKYLILICSLTLALALVVFDQFFLWPTFLEPIEKIKWLIVILLSISSILNLYFPLIDKKKRTIREFYNEITNSEKRMKFYITSLSLISIIIFSYVIIFHVKRTSIVSNSPATNATNVIQHKSYSQNTITKAESVENNLKIVKKDNPNLKAAYVDRSFDINIFEPDIVILTKSLSEFPKDLINNSFLSKIVTKETMFYYEDNPSYLSALGILKRISYEHNLGLEENLIKFILAMPAEVALWKGSDGKMRDFLFIANENNINQSLLNFYLKIKELKSDSQIRTFNHMNQKGFVLKIMNQEVSIWSHENKLYITTLNPSFFPENNNIKLEQLISTTVVNDVKKGFYKRLFNIDSQEKHSLILNSNYLTFGYNYFIPSLKAIKFDFEENENNWKIQSFINGDSTFKNASTQELWKVFPKSSSMCIGLPINGNKITTILNKYKELTSKRIRKETELNNKQEPKKVAESDNTQQIDSNSEIEEINKMLLTDSEITDLAPNVIAACWYKDSTIFTPLFISKASNALKMKDKIKYFFNIFIGGLEKNLQYNDIIENQNNDITIFSRQISSTYGLNQLKDEEFSKSEHKFENYFTTKFAFNNDYLIFSPDGKLVDQAISTLTKKSPSLHDELKLENKNISYLLNPRDFSQLLEKYMKEALPKEHEVVFRTAIEKHLTSTFKNLSTIKPIGIDMPAPNEDSSLKWNKLKIQEL